MYPPSPPRAPPTPLSPKKIQDCNLPLRAITPYFNCIKLQIFQQQNTGFLIAFLEFE